MRFSEERFLNLKSDAGVGWARYRWDNGSQRWRYVQSNDGFHRCFDVPSSFSEDDRLLLEIKLGAE